MSEEKIESALKGNTLRVYWFLLRSPNDMVGARETQRALKFSSPALAVYHLDKLIELGLAEKTNGEYRLVKAVNVGVLKQFIRFGALMLPRHFLYATMFTTLLIFFLGLLATGIMWYETIRAWRQKP
jgi:hypothetical protein